MENHAPTDAPAGQLGVPQRAEFRAASSSWQSAT